MTAILYKFPGESWAQLGGMTLLERNLRSLDQIKIAKARIVLPPGELAPPISIPRPLGVEWEIVHATLPRINPLPALRAAIPDNSEPSLLFHANLLIDPRILAFLAGSASSPSLFTLGPNTATEENWRIALLEAKDLERPG